VQSKDAIKVITVRTTAFDSASTGGSATIESVRRGRCRCGQSRRARIDAVGAPGAHQCEDRDFGGRGLGSGDNFKLSKPWPISSMPLGASRAAVDAATCPTIPGGPDGQDRRADLYIAVGISAPFNTLPDEGQQGDRGDQQGSEAPIFQIADYGLVGDLFEIIPQFTAKLSS